MSTVSAFWGDRPEDQADAGTRLAACLGRLGDVDPVLSQWRLKGSSRTAAAENAALPIDAQALAGHLEVQHRDSSRAPMSTLGYSFAAWNGGHAGDDAAFSCTVGLHARHPGLRNSAVVRLPTRWAAASSQVDAVARVLREVWDPDEIAFFGEDGRRETLWRRGGSTRHRLLRTLTSIRRSKR